MTATTLDKARRTAISRLTACLSDAVSRSLFVQSREPLCFERAREMAATLVELFDGSGDVEHADALAQEWWALVRSGEIPR